MRTWTTRSVEETEALGESLAGELAPDGLLLLHGDLGSGKTVLTRGIARGLGIDPGEVQSPTFVLVREHAGRASALVHVDLYRLEPEQTAALGLEELFEGLGDASAVKVVEWAERLPRRPAADLELELRRTGDPNGRSIRELSPSTPGATGEAGAP
jgi:tRNA threonylcarbamoyladenosine biosynthesis protein TsaE